ncbi:MAG: NUDIX hydrolase [Myxococcales bacterium]|nr:NUDIX hydrolase [Myxococcales bacterium]
MNAEDTEFLRTYRASAERFARPSVTVDLVVFTVRDADLKLLLVRRKEPPFRGEWALPGGFVRVGDAFADQGEDVDAAAHRELEEETGLPRGTAFLEQLYTFGRAGRDPRMRIISVAYYALIRPDLAPMVTAGTDAAAVAWFSVAHERPARLAFDHDEIVQTGIERIRGKIDYAPIAFDLVPETFTVADLRAVYEAIKGNEYDAANFRRRFRRMQDDGLVEAAPGKRHTARRPAAVYRFVRR